MVAVLPMEPTAGPRLTFLSDLVGGLVRDAEANAEARRTGQKRGPITGLAGLDRVLGGFMRPGVHLLQAAPGAGKTAFCLQAATDCQCPALYVAAEQPPHVLFERVIARQTKTFLEKLRSGELPPAEVERLARQTAQQAARLAFLDGTLSAVSPSMILQAAEVLRDRFETSSVLIVLDSIQVWARRIHPDLGEYDRVTAAADNADALGLELSCPVLGVSHRNRMGQRSGDKLHAGKGSGDLEYAGQSVMDLDAADSKGEVLTDATLLICKNRWGAQQVELSLQFEGRLQRFREA